MKRCNPLAATLFALAFGLAALTGCGGDADTDSSGEGAENGATTSSVTVDHGSPEKLFNSMMRAAAAGDNAALFSGMMPSMQSEMASGMIAMAGMVPGADKPGMIAVLKAHGINESDLPSIGPAMEAKSKELADGIKDKPAFIAAMMTKLPNASASGEGMSAMFAGTGADAVKLTDLKKDGDHASAKVTGAGQVSEEDDRIHFTRVDGKWYMDPKSSE